MDFKWNNQLYIDVMQWRRELSDAILFLTDSNWIIAIISSQNKLKFYYYIIGQWNGFIENDPNKYLIDYGVDHVNVFNISRENVRKSYFDFWRSHYKCNRA